jgi:hypothetical protein
MLWKKVRGIITSMSTLQLILLPTLLSLLPITILIRISNGHYSGKPIEDILISIIIFLWGIMGIPMILRREAPGLFLYTKGWLAIIEGILILVASWSVAIALVVFSHR